jgi:thiol:disulfide interchange protein DsbA
LKRAAQLTQAYKIDGVPSMTVNGKYVVNTDHIKSFEQLLGVTDYLIEMVRKQGGGKPVPNK